LIFKMIKLFLKKSHLATSLSVQENLSLYSGNISKKKTISIKGKVITNIEKVSSLI
jgi:hypothetical protein